MCHGSYNIKLYSMYGTGYTGKTKMPLSLVFQKNLSFRIDLEITHSILPHLTDFRKCSGNLPSTNAVQSCANAEVDSRDVHISFLKVSNLWQTKLFLLTALIGNFSN